MNAILFIEDRYIESFDDLKSLVEAETKPDSSISKQLIAAGCDGALEQWLVEDFEAQRLGIVFDVDYFVSLNSDIKRLEYLKEVLFVNSNSSLSQYTGLFEMLKCPDTGTFIRSVKEMDTRTREKVTLEFVFKTNTEMDERIHLRLLDSIQVLDFNILNVKELKYEIKISEIMPGDTLQLQIVETGDVLWRYTVPLDLKFYFGSGSLLNNTGDSFVMKFIKGGQFQMGSGDDSGSHMNEKPQHLVLLSDFYIGETVVTQSLWKKMMNSNPSHFVGDDLPVENVTWEDTDENNSVQEFINRLNEQMCYLLPKGWFFRLPTEAEWEYVANKIGVRAWVGMTIRNISQRIANGLKGIENDINKTFPVKLGLSNELGIYGMDGNVWEWCQDWYSSDYYEKSPSVNPQGPSMGSEKVLRGGHGFCSVKNRYHKLPDYHDNYISFRLALSCMKPND